MKKVIVSIAAVFACYNAAIATENEEKMYLWLKNGDVVEYSVSNVDSLTFKKTTNENPVNPGTGVDPKETMAALRSDLQTKAPSVSNDSYGSTTHYTYYSSTAQHDKGVNVLLPPNYDKNKKYPVLFVLHGIFGDEGSMIGNNMGVEKMISNAIKQNKTKDMIVVFPQMYTSTTSDQPAGMSFDAETMANYDKFLYDLADDLLPWVKNNFSVAEGRENTAITGFSMGGREALYIGTQRTDIFGFVGAACPAPGIVPAKDMFATHVGSIKNESDFRIKVGNPDPYILLITGGTSDTVVGDFPEQYHTILERNGVDHVWHSIPGTGHDASSVEPHLYNFLTHIFNVD